MSTKINKITRIRLDELVKSQNSDGKVKSSSSRRRPPKFGGGRNEAYIKVRRNDERCSATKKSAP